MFTNNPTSTRKAPRGECSGIQGYPVEATRSDSVSNIDPLYCRDYRVTYSNAPNSVPPISYLYTELCVNPRRWGKQKKTL